MITRRGLLAGLLAGVALPAFGEVIDRSPRPRTRGDAGAPVPSARGPVDSADLIAAAKLGGAVAFVLADATTGEVLEAREPVYRSADLTIVSREVPHDRIVDECIDALRARLCAGAPANQHTTDG